MKMTRNAVEALLTRARPGVWATFARPGEGWMTVPLPDNSKTKKDSDKQ